MSVASHLAVSPAQYDARIRSLIPLYDALIAEVARALGHAGSFRFVVDLDLWLTHLGKTFGSRARGRRVYESWADEDVYVPLAEEIHLLTRDGPAVVGMLPRP